ncbi:hypothetical protein [Kingella negevensis]|uniref:Lipoprotein n=1 Tax=Kingella negevensis TaxID=1522312 RepID=A0A238HI71_9NEIS|nr:hypothetical protein [Kingella negevensis]MDK4679722.1 hypothetical protein [Kingella negevensis]MDK4682560.1 hypothetical protein [Kingella negevensis]MDK4684425.1 hypothetical protein [Kingella negevensis]MDK4688757.1 hypothetical protein [Kingella negevensis]MDK4690756.1 hypothetical protein [Kingella negevensis]
MKFLNTLFALFCALFVVGLGACALASVTSPAEFHAFAISLFAGMFFEFWIMAKVFNAIAYESTPPKSDETPSQPETDNHIQHAISHKETSDNHENKP